ncbi:MAG: hypothetical protein DRR00_23580, partial [Candidatus Parabeggiatoa sp. nov. 3]
LTIFCFVQKRHFDRLFRLTKFKARARARALCILCILSVVRFYIKDKSINLSFMPRVLIDAQDLWIKKIELPAKKWEKIIFWLILTILNSQFSIFNFTRVVKLQ